MKTKTVLTAALVFACSPFALGAALSASSANNCVPANQHTRLGFICLTDGRLVYRTAFTRYTGAVHIERPATNVEVRFYRDVVSRRLVAAPG